MIKLDFNKNWKFKRLNEEVFQDITLPHDAMIFEERDINSRGGINISFFKGGVYHYEKSFNIPNFNKNQVIYLEFEGIYHHVKIYVNEKEVIYKKYGYSDFFVDISEYVNENENVIKVIVDNDNQPNSRWYTGSGIYKDVNLYILEKEHIILNSTKVKTVDYKNRIVNLSLNTSGIGNVEVLFKHNELSKKIIKESQGELSFDVELSDFPLWDENSPNLITCIIKFKNDEHIIRFGIREIKLDKEKGLLINGNRVILKGACIHHDNGFLGAVSNRFAEYRKVKLLKDAGYNAIRSAHNPISKHILNACDELGMYILDEYVDMWYIHKTQYDYASYVEDNYQTDLLEMITKDYNHPSCIMYSLGNEVAETSEKRGIELTKKMVDYVHLYDDTRPVTCGVNIFFNLLYRLGFGQYSDEKAKKDALKKPNENKHSFGSEFFNNLAGLLGADFMKFGASLPFCDWVTKEAFAHMDVAGYNYGIERYLNDLKKYPNRFILGTETFCKDSYKFYELAKNNPRLIGDFVWAGIDYIGEVGVGSWTVDEYCNSDFSHLLNWILAGSGRIDITGKLTSEVDYTRVCFDLDVINIGVIPVHHYKNKHSSSSWKFSRCEKSWTYHGYENKETEVEVYAKGHHVELYLNDKLIGKQTFKDIPRYVFKIKYNPGILKAVVYDKLNNILGKSELNTSYDEPKLILKPEIYSFNKEDLIYVRAYLGDENSVHTYLRDIISIDMIENGELLGFANACSYYEDDYKSSKSDTFYGECLMIIKPNYQDDVLIKCSSSYGTSECIVKMINDD